MTRSDEGRRSRTAILGLVKTPLSFFVLFVLVGEAVVGVLSGLGKLEGAQLTVASLTILGLPGVAVAFLTIYSPEALIGKELTQRIVRPRFLLYLAAPLDMPGLDVLRISWDGERCYIIGAELREKVKLVAARPGRALRVNLTEQLLDRLKPDEPLELELYDTKGYRWEVKPFFLLENLVHLVAAEARDRIIREYGRARE